MNKEIIKIAIRNYNVDYTDIIALALLNIVNYSNNHNTEMSYLFVKNENNEYSINFDTNLFKNNYIDVALNLNLENDFLKKLKCEHILQFNANSYIDVASLVLNHYLKYIVTALIKTKLTQLNYLELQVDTEKLENKINSCCAAIQKEFFNTLPIYQSITSIFIPNYFTPTNLIEHVHHAVKILKDILLQSLLNVIEQHFYTNLFKLCRNNVDFYKINTFAQCKHELNYTNYFTDDSLVKLKNMLSNALVIYKENYTWKVSFMHETKSSHINSLPKEIRNVEFSKLSHSKLRQLEKQTNFNFVDILKIDKFGNTVDANTYWGAYYFRKQWQQYIESKINELEGNYNESK